MWFLLDVPFDDFTAILMELWQQFQEVFELGLDLLSVMLAFGLESVVQGVESECGETFIVFCGCFVLAELVELGEI